MNRREAIFSLGALAATAKTVKSARAVEMHGLPAETQMAPDALPAPIQPGPFQVITETTDQLTLKAAFDRIIPHDAHGPSASEAGCLTFVDRQLAGDYGAGAALFLKGPLGPDNEADVMGSAQTLASPRERYKSGLQALEAYAQANDHTGFSNLPPERIDAILEGLESGKITLANGVDGQAFFELMLTDARQGYLSDPVYGGNKGMAGWKMIGFPGARYDYRPYVDRWNQDLGLEPVSLIPND